MKQNAVMSHVVTRVLLFVLVCSLLIIALYPHIVPMPLNSVFDLDFHGKLSYVFEIIIVNFIFVGVLIFSGRFWFSVVSVMVLYALVVVANTVKLKILEAPVFHTDLIHASELLLQWSVLKYILVWMIPAVVVLFFVLRYVWRAASPRNHGAKSKAYYLMAWAVIIFFSVVNRPHIKQNLIEHNLYYSKINALVSAADLGYLTVFFQRLLLESSEMEVNGYSKEKIQSIVDKYQLHKRQQASDTTKPNIIYIMVEAFTNPNDFGWETNLPVMPHFEGVRRTGNGGRLFSPVVGGKSANAEFELLTGLSMRLLPTNAIPYTDQIKKPVPGVVSELKQNGYFASAIHMASLSFFNYKQVYQYLGFDEIFTLWGDEAVKFNAIGNYPAAQHWIKKIIDVVESSEEPAFIFTFPSYPHGPWDYDVYENAQLDVTNNQAMSRDDKKAYKNYVNIIHETDEALGEIIDYFAASEEKTMVVILGDHQPFLNEYGANLYAAFDNDKIDDDVARIYTHYQTPVAVWSNFDLEMQPVDLSMNFLSGFILEALGFEPSGLMKFNAVMREKLAIFSWVISPGKNRYVIEEPAHMQGMIDDYRTLQYDLLQGENYLQQIIQDQ